MGGKAKWRKMKKVVAPTSPGTQPLAKQHFKKERTKTRDAKHKRMGDAGEEDDEADDIADGAKKEAKPAKDALTDTSSNKGQESSNSCSHIHQKTTSQKDSKIELVQAEVTEVAQEHNGVDESIVTQTPEVMVTDLDKELDSPAIEGLQKPTSEETLKEELRKATEEECPQTEEVQLENKPADNANDLETSTTEIMSPEISGELQLTQKATQTDAVIINDDEKPVKFFISDDSDSDTAIFVDAHQATSNGEYEQPQESINTSQQTGDKGIEFRAVIDVRGESTVEVTVEGEDIEVGIEDITEMRETADPMAESPVITQLIDMEPNESPKSHSVQKTKYLPSLAQPVKTETQKMRATVRRHIPTKFPFDHLAEGDNVSRSSASDSVDTVSITRSSVSDLADPDNISKTSTSDLDTPSGTSTNESIEHEIVSKVSITEAAEQEFSTISTAESINIDVTSKMSTVESDKPGNISKSSTKGSLDQDIISKSSASESGEQEFISRISVSESGEQELQSKTSYSEYEEAECITRTSASESGEPDSMSRTSVSESGDGTSRTSVSDSVDDTSKASITATETSVSATGEYTSKSSYSYSSEFDAESLSSTADLLTPKEEISYASDVKAEPGIGESAKLEDDSPTGSPEVTETTEDRPSSPAWEQLNLEDQVQLTEMGVISEKAPSKGTEADAESIFFSLYPEYQPGEVDESEETPLKKTAGNPKVLCFRGQTPDQSETQEEIYMAAEKGGVTGSKDGRNKGTVSGKIHQLQRKLSQQKKPAREDKEVTELEGSASQHTGSSNSEQHGNAKQSSQENSKGGGPEPSSDPTREQPLPNVLNSSTPTSVTPAINAKKTEHAISKEEDNLVCLTGQLGEQVENLIEATEIIAEAVADITQDESKPSEIEEAITSGTEIGQEALEAENKLEGNAKDRKTLVGKARDWIKGVTRLGGKKEDTNDKINGKTKPETDVKTYLERKKAAEGKGISLSDEEQHTSERSKENHEVKATEQESAGTEKEEASAGKGEVTEEEKGKQADEQHEDSDSTLNKDIGMSIDEQAEEMKNAETDEKENIKNAGKVFKEDIEDKAIEKNVEEEKADTEATREDPTEQAKNADQADIESKEEESFDIVSPEEELSDSVFKDDADSGNGKAKENDDNDVKDEKTAELLDAKTEKINDEPVEEAIKSTLCKEGETPSKEEEVKEDDTPEEKASKYELDASADAVRQAEDDKQENEETVSKYSEASFVSVQKGTGPEVNVETVSEVIEKQRKTTKDNLKPQRKRHEKSKSPSVLEDGGRKESPKASRREKEGRTGSKKRRHRRRTKSHEDGTDEQKAVLQAVDVAKNSEEPKPEENVQSSEEPKPEENVQSSEEPKPEDVALPQDDFENEKEPLPEKDTENEKEITVKHEKTKTDEEVKSENHCSPEGKDKVTAEEAVPSEVVSQKQEMKESQPLCDSSVLKEKKRSSSKSSKDKKHSRKTDEQLMLGSEEQFAVEHKCHSKSRRKKSLDLKQEKHDLEKLEKDIRKTVEKPEKSTWEKIQSDGEVQSSFTAATATWSPRVGRKDRKSSRKSSDRKRDGQSSDTPKVQKEKKDETELSVPSKASTEVGDDVSCKKSPKKVKSRKPDLSLYTMEPREDTPIPSPKSHQFKLDINLAEESQKPSQKPASVGSQPLLQVLTFPEGVSKPISPLPPSKEFKFPPGVTKPVSPLPESKKTPFIISKPIPAPMTLKLDVEPAKPLSPLKTLTFPEGISTPISPLPKKISQPIPKPVPFSIEVDKPLPYPAKPVSSSLEEDKPLPYPAKSVPSSLEVDKPLPYPAKPVSSSLKVDKPLPYPAKPVSPLKMLHFPEGIPKPISPLPAKSNESAFTTLAATSKDTSSVSDDQESKKETPKTVTTLTKTEAEEVSKPVSPPLKKPRPRIIIPKEETQTIDASPEPPKPISPLKFLKFPEGISKPVSPIIQKTQQALFKVDTKYEKKEKTIPEPLTLMPDLTKRDLPMTSAALPVSPLRTITFPAGIAKPVSPTPSKVSKPLPKPITASKPIPQALTLEKASDEISEKDTSQIEKKSAEPSQPVSKTSKTLTTLTFPVGVSKPISPLPQKTKFSSELFKSTQATTKPSSPSTDLAKSSQETVKPLLIPSEFFKTVHADEDPIMSSSELIKSVQAVAKPSLAPKEFLKFSEPGSLKVCSPDHSSQMKTFKFPEGVSMPVSPLPPKARTPIVTSLAQKIQADSTIPVSSTRTVKIAQESATVFPFPQIKKQEPKTEDFPTPPLPTSPTVQTVEGLSNIAISPAPLKIKHTVDFPSDTFPSTASYSPKTASSPITKSPGPKVSSPISKMSPTEQKPASLMTKTASPVTKVAQTVPIPNAEVTIALEMPTLTSKSLTSESKYPKSILSTKLRPSQEVSKIHSSEYLHKTHSDFIKTSISPDPSQKIKTETTKSTISQTHLTYSEVSKRFTPSPRLADEISKEITATPPMTPPPEAEQQNSPRTIKSEKSTKISTTPIQTAEVRSAARYSRGEESHPSQIHKSHEVQHPSPDASDSHHEESRSPTAGTDSSSKKLRRRKRR